MSPPWFCILPAWNARFKVPWTWCHILLTLRYRALTHQWSIHGIHWPMKDLEYGRVHWQVILWCIFYPWSPFGGANATQPVYWLYVWAPHSIGWSSELRLAVAVMGFIQYCWILEGQVHLNLPILRSLPNYYSFCFYYLYILLVLLLLWYHTETILSNSFWNWMTCVVSTYFLFSIKNN